MAKTKEKKISVNQFESVMKDMNPDVDTVIHWRGLNITVHRTLRLKDMMQFVRNVVNSCFNENMEYNPEAEEFAIKTNILTLYANFTMPANLELQYDLLYTTDAVHAVLEQVNPEQMEEIRNAITERIRYRIRANVENVNRQMTDLYNAFDHIQQQISQISDVFDGIGSGDIKDLVNAVSSGGIVEDKLVDAYINQMKRRKEHEEQEAAPDKDSE